MTTWTDIFPELDGPPVKGVPSEFSTVATSFTTMNDDARAILEQFTKIMTADGVEQIQGAVAGPLRNFVDEVSDRLGSLPEVSESAAKVFANHATKLDTFRDAADTALANAITKWGQCKTAKANLSSAATSADHLKTQLDNAPADADPSSTTQLQGQHTDAADKVTSCRSQLTSLNGELAQFKTTWTNLREDERKLRETTIGDLDDIDLHSLEDPGWFDSFCESAFEVLKWVYEVTGLEDLVDLINAIAQGDWAKALWALRELLDKVITILSIVVLFVCPQLFLVILVLSVIKLGVDAILYASNTPNPETGQRISLTDLAFDALDVVLAGKDFQGAKAAMRLGRPATELARGRQLIDDASSYLDTAGQPLSRNGQRRAEALLRRYHIDPVTTVINRGNRPALRYVMPGSMTRFNLKLTEHALQDGHDVLNGAYLAGQQATDGPSTEDVKRTMDPNQSRPYFNVPSGNQWFNVMEIPPHPMNATDTTTPDAFVDEEIDSFGIGLPEHWLLLPLQRGDFDRAVDGLRRKWRTDGMSRTDQRRCEVLLQRVRSELLDEGVTFAAASFEKARRDGVEQVEANSEWLLCVCTFSVVTATSLGTDMRLSIPVLFGAFSQRSSGNELAKITDIRPPEVCTLPSGRAVRLRRLYQSNKLQARVERWFGETYVVPIGTSGRMVGMLQFTTTNVELAPEFSDFFLRLAHTMTFFRPDDPTVFNGGPDDDGAQ